MSPKPIARRKVCVVLVDRANYGRLKPVMRAIDEHADLELTVLAAGTMVLERFGMPVQVVRNDGFSVHGEVYLELEGSTPVTMAKSVGFGVVEFANEFRRLEPDLVLLIGDRYEALAAAIAAAYMNLCIVHMQGGEVSGSIDESARHAITKFSHFHYPSTRRAADYLIQMGESRGTILGVGCPSGDIARQLDTTLTSEMVNRHGSGCVIDTSEPFLLVIFHPTTTEFGGARRQMEALLTALHRLRLQTILLWPNIDAGAGHVSKTIRQFRTENDVSWLRTLINLPPESFLNLVANAACAVGNSSSFVRDASFFGTPVVLVGGRQDGREADEHVLRASPVADDLERAIRRQLRRGRYSASNLYGDGFASQRLADSLAQLSPYVQKRLDYVDQLVVDGQNHPRDNGEELSRSQLPAKGEDKSAPAHGPSLRPIVHNGQRTLLFGQAVSRLPATTTSSSGPANGHAIQPKILVAEATRFDAQAAASMRQIGDVDLHDLDRSKLIEAVGAVDVLWVRLRHRIDAELLSHAVRLKFIVSPTTGLDHIDLEAARQRGIQVLSLHGESTFLNDVRATAEHTLGLTLSLLRNVNEAVSHVKTGGWNRDLFCGSELYGRTVGVVGYGRLGKLVARYLNALEARVLVCDPNVEAVAVPREVSLVTLPQLLERADIVTLHADLQPSNHLLIGETQLRRMKRGAYLINTARGGLIDESALLGALRSRHLGGAALDVLCLDDCAEADLHPLVDYARRHDNLIVTPHLGGCTIESIQKTEQFMAAKFCSAWADVVRSKGLFFARSPREEASELSSPPGVLNHAD